MSIGRVSPTARLLVVVATKCWTLFVAYLHKVAVYFGRTTDHDRLDTRQTEYSHPTASLGGMFKSFCGATVSIGFTLGSQIPASVIHYDRSAQVAHALLTCRPTMTEGSITEPQSLRAIAKTARDSNYITHRVTSSR
ncbi:hypothetical protein BV22DRAFT_50541 [Leucogyrophana mollusca]|uniref:Uncharacterized protein n=1 Tax=Leucogyrophana mollusca TaxID=85980 RepID=A0ACB8C103_9AGAM|nr:hypothetical protein BV22DRAFT_50541 [Leucogyrophana mollusca]